MASFLINECGLKDGKARIISPHKNFKAFLIMNPLHGEISRAMRNRCIEICFTGSATTDDLLDASRGKGIHNLSTAVQLKHVHDTIDTSTTIPALRPSPRDFTAFSNLVSSQISHGSTLDEAMQRGYNKFILLNNLNGINSMNLCTRSMHMQIPTLGYIPGYLHSSINLDSITYTYQRDAAYLLFLLQISGDEKNLTNTLFLGNIDRSKFSITTNVSKSLVKLALNEYISLGNIIDWEERLLWLSSHVIHEKIKREKIISLKLSQELGNQCFSHLFTQKFFC